MAQAAAGGIALRAIGGVVLAILGTAAFRWTAGALAVNSQLPSSEEVNEVVQSSTEWAQKLKGLIGTVVVLVVLIMFATPLKKMVTKLVNRIKK